jgi:hypothetical protein
VVIEKVFKAPMQSRVIIRAGIHLRECAAERSGEKCNNKGRREQGSDTRLGGKNQALAGLLTKVDFFQPLMRVPLNSGLQQQAAGLIEPSSLPIYGVQCLRSLRMSVHTAILLQNCDIVLSRLAIP